MVYKEKKTDTKEYKISYRDSINKVIAKRQKEASEIRKNFCKDIFSDREKYLSVLKEQLGWPLNEKRPSKEPDYTTTLLSEEDGYNIYRMTFDILDGIMMSGILLKRTDGKTRPLVIAQHGGGGTPELITGFFDGYTGNYADMAMRIFEYDVNIFAPQLFLWCDEYDVQIDRVDIDAKLRSVGGSITALEIYGIQRILDYFEKESYVENFGMIGLSYGGFYTLFTSAIDDRIKAALSCSYFNDRNTISKFPDWRWKNASYNLHDAEIAALVYPRPLVILTGNTDDAFLADNAKNEYDRLSELCESVGEDWLDFEIFEGNHEFVKDDYFIKKVTSVLKNCNGYKL